MRRAKKWRSKILEEESRVYESILINQSEGVSVITLNRPDALNRSLACDLPTLLEMEAFAQGICFQSDEHKQLLREFLDHKK